MSNQKTPLDEFFNAARKVRRNVHSLNDIASALSRIGLNDLAAEIAATATTIEHGCATMQEAWSRDSSDHLAETKRNVGKTLLALVRAGSSEPAP
jgi:hypothetical protein